MVDFSMLWKGFKPLKFALYNQSECFFDGAYIEKTDQFLANTSIKFNGEYIAIWNVLEEIDEVILTSKMIHEMFHAFQQMNEDARFPNELEALKEYSYTAENLSIKLEENKLLAKLIERFDPIEYEHLLQLRSFRLSHYEYEYRYEAAIEQIEGSANYVELCTLKQISEEAFQKNLSSMLVQIQDPNKLIPIRIISYSIGALLFYAQKQNNLVDFEYFSNIPTTISILENHPSYYGIHNIHPKIQKIVSTYQKDTKQIIETAINQGDCVAEGEFELLGVNVYNARYQDNYIVSTYFVMYGVEGKQNILYGNFVIKLNERGKVTRIIKIK